MPGDGAPTFRALPKLTHQELAAVLARVRARIDKLLAREADDDGSEAGVLLSSVSGTPPAGPAFRQGKEPSWQKLHSSASRDLVVTDEGYSLHAHTRASADDAKGRLALYKYILRPPIAQERVQMRPDGLMQIALKRAFSDGTYAVALDPLSLLTRLCAAIPPPRFHTVRYGGVLASASKMRPHVLRKRPEPDTPPDAEAAEPDCDKPAFRHWRWAELLKKTFAINVMTCPSCQGRMRLVALAQEPTGIRRFLAARGELTDVPEPSPARAPPYFRSKVLRLRYGEHDDAAE